MYSSEKKSWGPQIANSHITNPQTTKIQGPQIRRVPHLRKVCKSDKFTEENMVFCSIQLDSTLDYNSSPTMSAFSIPYLPMLICCMGKKDVSRRVLGLLQISNTFFVPKGQQRYRYRTFFGQTNTYFVMRYIFFFYRTETIYFNAKQIQGELSFGRP